MSNMVVRLSRLRPVAVALLAVGQVVAVVGLVGALTSSADDLETTDATIVEPVATEAPTTVVATTAVTTTVVASSTTRPAESTVTSRPSALDRETLAEFVDEFNRENSAGDTTFALDRLHPVVISTFSEQRCREWLDARFSSTTIELVGEPTTPRRTTIETPSGPVDVDDYFSSSARLTFQGSISDATASFAYVDGTVHWFTNCESS